MEAHSTMKPIAHMLCILMKVNIMGYNLRILNWCQSVAPYPVT